jgi:hypothetical protein
MTKHDWQNGCFAVVNIQRWPAATDDYIPSGQNGAIGWILQALGESRRREAECELKRYQDLIDYARQHPLKLAKLWIAFT